MSFDVTVQMKKDTHSKTPVKKQKPKNELQCDMDTDSIGTNGALHCDKHVTIADLEFTLVRL